MTSQSATRSGTIPAAPTVYRGTWRYGDNEIIHGVRITSDRSNLFVANTHILDLANALADYLESRNNR